MLSTIWHFLFHRHQWEYEKLGDLINFNERGQRYIEGRRFQLKCKTCGTIKIKDM